MLLISEWALPAPGALSERLEAARSCGFDGVELVWSAEPSILHRHASEAVRRAAGEAGVVIGSLCTDPLSAWPAGVPGSSDTLERAVEAAVSLEVGQLVVNPGRSPVMVEDLLRRLDAAAGEAESAGLTLAIENGLHGDLIAVPDPPGLEQWCSSWALNLDVGNAVSTGTLDRWIELGGDRISSIHVKDWDLKRNEPALFGQGDVNWSWFSSQVATPSTVTVEHSRRAFGDAALADSLGSQVREQLSLRSREAPVHGR